MRTLFITATVALFLGAENTNAIKLQNKVRFIDDVVKMLAEAEEKDLAEENPSQLGQCNPCYTSNLGPNPHYPYKAEKTVPNYKTEGKTTDYAGPVTSDANVPGGAKAAGGEEKKAALSQMDCNPCYTSNTGPNTHWDYPGNKGAKPFGSTNPPVAGDDKKEEEKKAALSQVECNPCPDSSKGKNPHYPFTGGAAKEEGKKEEEKKAALSQVDCNPCPISAKGKNPHYDFDPNAKPAAKEEGKKEEEKKAALSQVDCNPCYQSNLGPNTHYNYEGNAKAVPFGKTVPAKKEGGKDEEKKEESKVQLIEDPYDQAHLNTYAEMISDKAEDSEPENPIVYA